MSLGYYCDYQPPSHFRNHILNQCLLGLCLLPLLLSMHHILLFLHMLKNFGLCPRHFEWYIINNLDCDIFLNKLFKSGS